MTTPMSFKTGKQPATPDARDLKFAAYFKGALPKPPHPDNFGSEKLVPNWGMLGNDAVGDCVFAGAAHETVLWNAMAGRPLSFTDAGVISDYSAVTGYNPADPATDQGTNVRDALNYRRQTGIVDAGGQRHLIGAYVSLAPRNFSHLLSALYLFGTVGVGIRFPNSAMNQFNQGKPWSRVKSTIDGGHYIPIVADRHGNPVCVTWGKLQPMTPAFYHAYVDESYAILSEEMLTGGKSVAGFDLAALQSDLKAL